MPKKHYAIESNGSKRLTIRWKGGIFLVEKDIEILFDENVVKTFADKADLAKPKKVKLKDGSIVRVQLEGKYNFKILRNGKPLDSFSSPGDRINTFANIFVILGVFIVVYRGILLIQGTSALEDWILWTGLLGGGILIGSGFEVKRKKYGFYALGILAFLVEFVIIIFERYQQNENFGTSLIIGAVVVYFMISAARKIPKIK